jgi:hypothetical protein
MYNQHSFRCTSAATRDAYLAAPRKLCASEEATFQTRCAPRLSTKKSPLRCRWLSFRLAMMTTLSSVAAIMTLTAPTMLCTHMRAR